MSAEHTAAWARAAQAGEPRFIGDICRTDESHGGERYTSAGTCRACSNARASREMRNRRVEKPEHVFITNVRNRAAKSGIPFDLTNDDCEPGAALGPIPSVCPVLGIGIAQGLSPCAAGLPSIDRIRPELGYVKGNVRWISFRANTLKSNATIKEIELVLLDLARIEYGLPPREAPRV